MDKIRFLCKEINKNEWSGVLFYTITGSMKSPSKLSIHAKDILLMDEGTKAATGFDWDGDVADYMMDNPIAMEEDWLWGHIHSHNDMSVFFSPTDMSELNDNGPVHNVYLSVIVNNFEEIKAKLVYVAEPTQYTAKDESGKNYTLTLKSDDLKPLLLMHECEIVTTKKVFNVGDTFVDRMNKIRGKAKLAAEERAKDYQTQKQNYSYNKSQTAKTPGFTEGNKNSTIAPYKGKHKQKLIANKKKEIEFEFEDYSDVDDNTEKPNVNEAFACYLLRMGLHLEEDKLANVLEDIEDANISTSALASYILDNYGSCYVDYFETDKSGDKDFLEILNAVVDSYKEHFEIQGYDFLEPIITGLTLLSSRYEKTLVTGINNN